MVAIIIDITERQHARCEIRVTSCGDTITLVYYFYGLLLTFMWAQAGVKCGHSDISVIFFIFFI